MCSFKDKTGIKLIIILPIPGLISTRPSIGYQILITRAPAHTSQVPITHLSIPPRYWSPTCNPNISSSDHSLVYHPRIRSPTHPSLPDSDHPPATQTSQVPITHLSTFPGSDHPPIHPSQILITHLQSKHLKFRSPTCPPLPGSDHPPVSGSDHPPVHPSYDPITHLSTPPRIRSPTCLCLRSPPLKAVTGACKLIDA